MLSRALTHLTPPFPQPNPSPFPLSPLLSSTHTRPHFQPSSALSPISTLHGSTHIHARVKPSWPHLHPPSRPHSFFSYSSHLIPSHPLPAFFCQAQRKTIRVHSAPLARQKLLVHSVSYLFTAPTISPHPKKHFSAPQPLPILANESSTYRTIRSGLTTTPLHCARATPYSTKRRKAES
jgi:hypothetical protein